MSGLGTSITQVRQRVLCLGCARDRGLCFCTEPSGTAGDGVSRQDMIQWIQLDSLFQAPCDLSQRRAHQGHPAGVLGGTEDHDERPAEGTAAHSRRLQADSEQGWEAQGVQILLDPHGSCSSCGLFLLQVHKLLIVVELLLGEIPDRLQFRQPSLKRSLMPYFLLTQGTTGSSLSHVPGFGGAGSLGNGGSGDFFPLLSRGFSCRLCVGRGRRQLSEDWSCSPCFPHSPCLTNTFSPPAVRTGNLAKFNQVLDQFGDKFQADGTYTLIIRLRHNVIKTGRSLQGWCLGTLGLPGSGGCTPVPPRRCPDDQLVLLSHLPG